MNREISSEKRLNIEIENMLYPLISLLKQTNASKVDIIRDIEQFKQRHRNLMRGLDRNYVESYLNKIYAKRNNGEILIEMENSTSEKER